MRKYRGRNDKRAHDHMRKHKIIGSILSSGRYSYHYRWFDIDDGI